MKVVPSNVRPSWHRAAMSWPSRSSRGVDLGALLHRGELAQQGYELVERIAIFGEAGCQRVDKTVEPFCQRECLIADGDEVEAVGIESLPRESQQSQTLEGVVHRLTFGESADVVQACVELLLASAVALQASAW